MSVFCSNCGNTLPQTARFCSSCGSVTNSIPPVGFPMYAPRLERPIYGRKLAGVCLAFARSYGWDVGFIRIIAVVTGIFLFPFVEICYIAGWIGIPEEMPGEIPPPQRV